MPKEVADLTFDSEVLNDDDVTLVDFWAPWCGPCRMIAPVLEELAKEYEGRAKIVKLNVDENPEVASRYGIQSIPTLLFFKGGKLVDSAIGLQSKEALSRRLDQVVAG